MLAEGNGTHSFRRNAERRSWIQPSEYTLHEGATGIRFWFFDNHLKAYQESRSYGLKGLELSTPKDACSAGPANIVMLEIDAPLELAGAFIYLDGMMVGQLADLSGQDNRGAEIEVPGLRPGDHEIVVENGRGGVASQHFKYQPSMAWPEQDRLKINLSQVADDRAA